MDDDSTAKNPNKVAGGKKSVKTTEYRRTFRDLCNLHDKKHPEGISKKDCERDVEDYMERFLGTDDYQLSFVTTRLIREALSYAIKNMEEDITNLIQNEEWQSRQQYQGTKEDIASVIEWADKPEIDLDDPNLEWSPEAEALFQARDRAEEAREAEEAARVKKASTSKSSDDMSDVVRFIQWESDDEE